MAVLRVNEEPAYDEVIGIGYDYSIVSSIPVRLKISNRYVPFSNNPPEGWKYSDIQRISLTKDSITYKPIKKRQFIKFKIIVAPGPYNTPSASVSKIDTANNNGAYAYPLIVDSYILGSHNYHILLYGPGALKVSNAIQVIYCALGSVNVSTGVKKYYDSFNSIGTFEKYNDWYGGPTNSNLPADANADIVWRLVTASGTNTSKYIDAYSGQNKNDTGGNYYNIGSDEVTNGSLGGYFSYKDGWWGSNPHGGGVSYFTYNSNGYFEPKYDSNSGHDWVDNYHFEKTISLGNYSIVQSGKVIFSGLTRQTTEGFWTVIYEGTVPNNVYRYTAKGNSSGEQTKEITIYLE